MPRPDTPPVAYLWAGDDTLDNRRRLEAAGYVVVRVSERPKYPATPLTPSFGGYFAIGFSSGDDDVFAWWTDGSLAKLDVREPNKFIPIARPDYAALWPAPAPEAPIADQPEIRYGVERVGFTSWLCSCNRNHPPEHVGCATCFDRNPNLRPTP